MKVSEPRWSGNWRLQIESPGRNANDLVLGGTGQIGRRAADTEVVQDSSAQPGSHDRPVGGGAYGVSVGVLMLARRYKTAFVTFVG